MVDQVARGVLTIGGYYLFGPLGAVAGGLISDVLFPVQLADVEGPRLNELNIQRSTVGAAIPIVYGTKVVAGNVIFHGGLIEEVTSEEQGGKGGQPSQTVTTYSYFVDLRISICDGEDGRPSKPQGIKKIWAYGDVIYDLSPQGEEETDEEFAARLAASEQTLELMTIYPGEETQLASPMIESYKGVGNVPGYRGLYSVEFARFPLNKYGNAVPQFRFEVYTGAAAEEDCSQYSAGQLYPWLSGATVDPRNPLNRHEYATDDGQPWSSDLQEVLDNFIGGTRTTFFGNLPHGWDVDDTTFGAHTPCYPVDDAESVRLFMFFNSLQIEGNNCNVIDDVAGDFEDIFGQGTVVHWNGDTGGGWLGSAYWVVTAPGVPETEYFEGQSSPGSFDLGGGKTLQFLPDATVNVRRVVLPPDPCIFGVPIPGSSGYCVLNGVITRSMAWTEVSGTFKVLQPYTQTDTFGTVTHYPVNPCLPIGDADYDNQPIWEAAYAQALADGEPIASGLVYGVDYPVVVSTAYQGECTAVAIDPDCVAMAAIVADICDRAGLDPSQYNTTGLTSCVYGYVIARPMSARDALSPLRMFGLWDCVEISGVLTFIERGGAIVDSFAEADLGVHEAGGAQPAVLEITRIQEKDLPRRIRVHYEDIDQNHEPGEQAASRLTTQATTEIDVNVPVSMTAAQAAQLAEVLLYDYWTSRNAFRFAGNYDKLPLTPADCVEIPVDGQTERVRILSIDHSRTGCLRFDAVRDDDEDYVSVAAPTEHDPSGGQGSAGDLVVCPSVMVLLDLPRLRDADTDCGYYAAVYGLCSSWTCAAIFRSPDGGLTYARIARVERQSTVGQITLIEGVPSGPSDLADSPLYISDSSTRILVDLATIGATLSSVTDEQLALGFNAAAIGADGRWQIILFKTATLLSGDLYELTDIVWSVNGTEANHGLAVAGDTFVLLDTTLMRLPEEVAFDGVAKLLKVVTCGQSIEDAEAQSFTTQCLSYRPDLISETPPDSSAGPGTVPIWNPDTGQFEPGCIRLEQLCNVAINSPLELNDALRYVGTDSTGPLFAFEPDTSDPGGFPDATYLTSEDETADLPNSLRLIAGSNIDIDVDTSGNTLEISSTAGGSGSLSFVAESTVAGAAATSISISGLNLDADEKYVINFTADNATGSNASISLYFNGDTTTTNYDRQAVTINSNLQTASRANDALIGTLNANAINVNHTTVPLARDLDGRPRSTWDRHGDNTTSLAAQLFWHMWRTANNVTQIQVTSSVANSLAIGSKLTIWKLTS